MGLRIACLYEIDDAGLARLEFGLGQSATKELISQPLCYNPFYSRIGPEADANSTGYCIGNGGLMLASLSPVAPLHAPNFSHYFAGACVERESAA